MARTLTSNGYEKVFFNTMFYKNSKKYLVPRCITSPRLVSWLWVTLNIFFSCYSEDDSKIESKLSTSTRIRKLSQESHAQL